MPAQLDHAGQLAPVLTGLADCLGGCFIDGEHGGSLLLPAWQEQAEDSMDDAEQGEQNRTASVGARQRRNWRTRRQAAGLVEVTAWVREADLVRAHALLEPLVEAAMTDMVRHGRQGQTKPVVAEVRFSGVPPAVFRERLRQEWGLEWDRAARCWRGTLEGEASVEELRRMVIPQWGLVEAG